MSILDSCPLIRKAALLIGYDNGMINREESEFLEKFEGVLGAERVTDVLKLENFLTSLSDEDFETLCVGEHLDQVAMESNCPFSEAEPDQRVTSLLGVIFDV